LKVLSIPNTNPKIGQGGVAGPAIQCAGRVAEGGLGNDTYNEALEQQGR
jgi:hypothetical protein